MMWHSTELGDLINVFDHKRVPLSSAQRRSRKGRYPYYGAQGIIDYIDDWIFDGRYILVPEDGENLRSRKLPIAYFASGQFWVNNHAHVLTARSGVATDRFVQAALQATDISSWVTGAAQPKLSQANLRRIVISIPAFSEQVRISHLLDVLDELIQNNRRRIEVLEEMALSIYREWFVHFRYPGHPRKVADGDLPGGWEVQPLSAVAALDRTSTQPSKYPGEAFDHYSIPAFDAGKLPVVELGMTIRSVKFVIDKAAVLVSKLNPRISRTWLVDAVTDRRAIASTEFLALRPLGASLAWLYLTVTAEPFQDRLKALSGGTSTSHQRAKPDDLMVIEVTRPPSELIEAFTAVVQPQLSLIGTLRTQARQLATLRDLLLPRLVSGEIDLSLLDLDELVATG